MPNVTIPAGTPWSLVNDYYRMLAARQLQPSGFESFLDPFSKGVSGAITNWADYYLKQQGADEQLRRQLELQAQKDWELGERQRAAQTAQLQRELTVRAQQFEYEQQRIQSQAQRQGEAIQQLTTLEGGYLQPQPPGRVPYQPNVVNEGVPMPEVPTPGRPAMGSAEAYTTALRELGPMATQLPPGYLAERGREERERRAELGRETRATAQEARATAERQERAQLEAKRQTASLLEKLTPHLTETGLANVEAALGLAAGSLRTAPAKPTSRDAFIAEQLEKLWPSMSVEEQKRILGLGARESVLPTSMSTTILGVAAQSPPKAELLERLGFYRPGQNTPEQARAEAEAAYAQAEAREVRVAGAAAGARTLATGEAALFVPLGQNADRWLLPGGLPASPTQTPAEVAAKGGRELTTQAAQAIMQARALIPNLRSYVGVLEAYPDASSSDAANWLKAGEANARLLLAKKSGGAPATLDALSGQVTRLIRAFGDTGNAAIQERAAFLTGLPGYAETKQSAATKLVTIMDGVEGAFAAVALAPPPEYAALRAQIAQRTGIGRTARKTIRLPSGKTVEVSD